MSTEQGLIHLKSRTHRRSISYKDLTWKKLLWKPVFKKYLRTLQKIKGRPSKMPFNDVRQKNVLPFWKPTNKLRTMRETVVTSSPDKINLEWFKIHPKEKMKLIPWEMEEVTRLKPLSIKKVKAWIFYWLRMNSYMKPTIEILTKKLAKEIAPFKKTSYGNKYLNYRDIVEKMHGVQVINGFVTFHPDVFQRVKLAELVIKILNQLQPRNMLEKIKWKGEKIYILYWQMKKICTPLALEKCWIFNVGREQPHDKLTTTFLEDQYIFPELEIIQDNDTTYPWRCTSWIRLKKTKEMKD
jgi:hypothetical protein